MTDISPLAAALLAIADITSDPIMAGRARYHERLLCAAQPGELEHLVKSIRDELDSYKSDYRDSLDQSDETRAAIQSTYDIAKSTINALIRLRQASVAKR
jgi:hypothetical protein